MTIEKKEKEISRKDFLKGVGASIAGVTLLGGVGGILTACSDQTTAEVQTTVEAKGKPEWPFPYAKLDADKAAERAYHAYLSKGG
ncbi:hypothetical protein [Clostridium formicaceticum]|uniref:Uncharacterized protein n=1 Tax=Clostridium formicaceticum TaxID=1497 RepID=A0AAC9RJT4_9CLOT|nr:hypothetical protein [Clostridium formicaceticum]AOY77806.1 hypothetical protein BJL90_19245 [Clostridium formicaceticum]ARE88416.1 hypothetical protein CLFO_28190 [Clostridium formicaceticum]